MIIEHSSYVPPKVETRNGLPYCTRCNGERDLCAYHKKSVRLGLGMLKTPMLYCSSSDISPLLKSRKDFGETE